MRKAAVHFDITLDEDHVPQEIIWSSTDQGEETLTPTKSMSVTVWDDEQKNTLRMDLWTKDMPVDEMKHYCVDSIGGMAQMLLTATGDAYMAEEMTQLCERLVTHLQQQNSAAGKGTSGESPLSANGKDGE